MASSRHLRTDSSDTSSSNGSSYHLILDHILTYPSSYEIPLRTMYQLNAASRAPHAASPSSASSSPVTPQGVFPPTFQDDRATQTFTENLMAQIQQLPSQPKVLPPSFISHFLQRCFPSKLVEVDFPQALTGLDYLKDLETRRRSEVRSAMDRLGIDLDSLDADQQSFAASHPEVAAWVKSIEEKERKIDALYTQLYIGLRRWILINELWLLPFNKHNCVAMLNTLYPPVISAQPTSRLTREILRNQRDGFFKYIQSVEKNGSHVLRTLMQQGKAPTDANGWPAVVRTLGLYLQLATSMINECSGLSDVTQVTSFSVNETKPTRHSRKADSGISFGVSASRTNSVAEPASPTESTRPKTPSGGKHSSALEKLARGLKTIGRSRTDVTEMIPEHPVTTASPPPAEKGNKTLRKMRSMGSLDSRKKAEAAAVQNLPFDPDEMRRQRLRYEAGVMATEKFGRHQSHEI